MNSNEIIIENRRKPIYKINEKYKDYIILDLTSKSNGKWVKFSPFYPHGNIPVPFSNGIFAETVEGIWQGLKIFENAGINISTFNIKNMKGIKRTTRKYGKIIGHQKGINSKEILNYNDAKKIIYIPAYKWVLENKLYEEITELKKIYEKYSLVFLDYNVNNELYNNKPLSHAFLVKIYIENKYPK
jgi:hypothetical protein